MRVYLNTSALNRPFDDLTSARVRLEAEAVAAIIAAAEAGQPEVAAQVPVCPREVLRPEPLPRLEHADAVALLRGPQRRDAPAEPAADDEHVEAGHAHPFRRRTLLDRMECPAPRS